MWHARELSQSLSGFTTKSVLFLYLLFFLSPSSSDIMFFLCLLNPHETSLFFFIARIPAHSISSISVWHMIAAVKTALILDNTHFCWLLILPAGSWNTQRYKNRIMLQQKRHKQSDTRRFQQDSRKKNTLWPQHYKQFATSSVKMFPIYVTSARGLGLMEEHERCFVCWSFMHKEYPNLTVYQQQLLAFPIFVCFLSSFPSHFYALWNR